MLKKMLFLRRQSWRQRVLAKHCKLLQKECARLEGSLNDFVSRFGCKKEAKDLLLMLEMYRDFIQGVLNSYCLYENVNEFIGKPPSRNPLAMAISTIILLRDSLKETAAAIVMAEQTMFLAKNFKPGTIEHQIFDLFKSP